MDTPTSSSPERPALPMNAPAASPREKPGLFGRLARIPTPTLALIVGALGSGAAQVAWNLPRDGVHVVAGIFATLLVPTSVHLFPRIAVTGFWTRAIRIVVMTYICGAAAAVNLWHAALLLTQNKVGDKFAPLTEGQAQVETVAAVLLVTAVEALMVMASLARRKPAERAAHPAGGETGVQAEQTVRVDAVPAAQPVRTVEDLVAAQAVPRSQSKQRAPRPRRKVAGRGSKLKVSPQEWAEELVKAGNPPPTAQQIMDETGASRSYSYKLAGEVAKQQRRLQVVGARDDEAAS